MASDTTLTIEPYSQHVQIILNNHTLADSDRSILLIETYAPDIYIPFEDIDLSCMEKTETKTHCDAKGCASHWTVRVGDAVATDAMWAYEFPQPLCVGIAGHAAFSFNQVETYVDGQLVRGHVRDPNKIITTELMASHLQMELGGEIIVNSTSWVMLNETDLPARFYVPVTDIKTEFMVPSKRQSVCTYKGEAIYYSIQVAGRLLENVVWSYPDPWLDFSMDISKISGLFGLYNSAFDRVLVDGKRLICDEFVNGADAAMQLAPTIDSTLAAKLSE